MAAAADLRGPPGARLPAGDGGQARALTGLRAAAAGEGAGHRGRRAGAEDPGRGGRAEVAAGDPGAGPPADGPLALDAAVADPGASGSPRRRPARHDDEAAAVILGLQDRATRDRAAEWMEGPEAEPALRLWRALARRCVGPYGEHAAAPLTLAGWVAWSTGDEPEARVALGRALRRRSRLPLRPAAAPGVQRGPGSRSRCAAACAGSGADQAVHAAVARGRCGVSTDTAGGDGPRAPRRRSAAADGGGHPERTGRRWPVRTHRTGRSERDRVRPARKRRPERQGRGARRTDGRARHARHDAAAADHGPAPDGPSGTPRV